MPAITVNHIIQIKSFKLISHAQINTAALHGFFSSNTHELNMTCIARKFKFPFP